MNIFGKLASALDPEYKAKTTEANAIRLQHQSQGGILKNQWYRLSNLSNNIVGLSFVCDCAREVQLLNLFEWLRDYECPQCKTKFSLLKALGLAPEASSAELAAKVATLPLRPRAAGAPPAPRMLDTWSGKDEGVGYEQHDPGMAGFGVGFGGK
jgi:hypothetical protein